MARQIKCKRCKKIIERGVVCQECKSALIPFYESSKDWYIAVEMEAQQRYVMRYSASDDYNEMAY